MPCFHDRALNFSLAIGHRAFMHEKVVLLRRLVASAHSRPERVQLIVAYMTRLATFSYNPFDVTKALVGNFRLTI